ncbi:TPA: hypothetical protein ACH3X1_014873 [Trebouxia sp. C0004]
MSASDVSSNASKSAPVGQPPDFLLAVFEKRSRANKGDAKLPALLKRQLEQSAITSAAVPVPKDQEAAFINAALLDMLVMCNVSFNTVDSAWFRRFCGTIRPGFVPLCASTMRTTALDNQHPKVCIGIKQLLKAIKFPLLSTFGWTNINEQLIIVLEEFGPENFGAVVSDNGGGCENGRKLTKEKYPHLAIQRHWLRTEMDLLKLSDLVLYKGLTWLVVAATTRFSSTCNCMLSVLRLQQAFNNMLQKHEAELTGSKATAGQTAAVKIIKSKVFWRDLDILAPIAKPFNQACICHTIMAYPFTLGRSRICLIHSPECRFAKQCKAMSQNWQMLADT